MFQTIVSGRVVTHSPPKISSSLDQYMRQPLGTVIWAMPS